MKSNSVESNNGGIPFLDSMPSAYKNCRKTILSEFEKYDEPANDRQKLHILLGKIIFTIAFLAILVIAVGISFYVVIPKLVFLIELILLLIITPIYILTRKSDPHIAWIEKRKKAEYLRILQFSILSGKPKSLQYFNDICSIDKIKDIMEDINSIDLKDLKNYIESNWFEDQKKHHNNKIRNCIKKEGTFIWITRFLYVIAIFIAGLHYFGNFHNAENLLLFLSIILPALCATLVAIKTLRDYKTILLNSENMAKEIESIISNLDKCTSLSEFQNIIQEAESVFLNELERWVILVSSRELELTL